MKFFILVLVGVAFVASTRADKPIPWFDCTGREDGNYPHPVDCTRFISCSNELAYERDCAVCEYNPIRCPEERLIFDQHVNECLFADEADCQSLCDNVNRRRHKALRGEKLL